MILIAAYLLGFFTAIGLVVLMAFCELTELTR